MPVPSELTEGNIHEFFSTWRATSRSTAELADMMEAVAVQVVRGASVAAPAATIGALEIHPSQVSPEVKAMIAELVKKEVEEALGTPDAPHAGTHKVAAHTTKK